MERRTTQATAWSVALHVALLATVLLIRPHAGEGPSRISIINAELLFDAGAWSSSANVDAAQDGAAAARATQDPIAPEPTDTREPATDAPVADAHEPARADRAAELPPEPADEARETAEELADASRGSPTEAAAAAEPAAKPADEPQQSVADAAAEASPAGASEVAAAAAAPSSPETVASAAPSDAAAATELPPGVPLQTGERQMIEKRFASWTGRFAPGKGEPSVDWKQDGRAYTAVFRAPSAADPMGLEHVVVDVSTEQGGKRMSTQLTMTRLAFSNFAQFVNTWDPNVQIHDDVIDGRFHSNTSINFLSTGRASPLFKGKVTIASHDLEAFASGPFNRRKMFPEGVDTGVRRIMLPSGFAPFLNAAASGEDGVQRFERDARITFYPDGTYGWSYLEDGAREQLRRVAGPAHYLLGLENATLRIKGTVSGKVLVYSKRDLVIEDDLRYAGGRDGDDYLGLVSELDVEIAAPDVTGPGDFVVEGSIYALRRFAVRDFRSRRSGTLAIYGSVTAGSITATEPRFATKIEFDRRLTKARPPSFPLTDRYELESWNGEWHVEEPALDEAAIEDAIFEGSAFEDRGDEDVKN